MQTAILLNADDSKTSFLRVYKWLQSNVGERKTWSIARVTGQGWSLDIDRVLNRGQIIATIQDPQKAMMFVLHFGGEIIEPNVIDNDLDFPHNN